MRCLLAAFAFDLNIHELCRLLAPRPWLLGGWSLVVGVLLLLMMVCCFKLQLISSLW